MSKSKGNTLDPIDLIDGIDLDALVAKRTSGLMNPKQAQAIEKKTRKEYPTGIPAFGTDALRFTFASLATPGRNINFDLSRCEGYRNFCNKLWNASRFVLMNCEGKDNGLEVCFGDCGPSGPLHFSFVDQWIVSELQRVEDEVERQLTAYRFDLAAKAIYEFVWNEFCDWYLELAKISLQSPAENAQKAARRTLLRTLEATLRLVHPFMPFITEALWQAVAPVAGRSQALVQGEFASISTAAFPKAELKKIESQCDAQMSQLKALVGAIRSLRAEMGLGPGDKVPLRIQVDKGAEKADSVDPLNFEVDSHERTLALAGLAALCRLSEVSVVSASDMLATHSAQSQQATTALAPVQILGRLRLRLEVEIDLEAEKARLQKEIDRLNQEIAKCKTKLSNPQFVDRAPAAVVQQEQTRLTEFEVALSKVDGQHQAILRA